MADFWMNFCGWCLVSICWRYGWNSEAYFLAHPVYGGTVWRVTSYFLYLYHERPCGAETSVCISSIAKNKNSSFFLVFFCYPLFLLVIFSFFSSFFIFSLHPFTLIFSFISPLPSFPFSLLFLPLPLLEVHHQKSSQGVCGSSISISSGICDSVLAKVDFFAL